MLSAHRDPAPTTEPGSSLHGGTASQPRGRWRRGRAGVFSCVAGDVFGISRASSPNPSQPSSTRRSAA